MNMLLMFSSSSFTAQDSNDQSESFHRMTNHNHTTDEKVLLLRMGGRVLAMAYIGRTMANGSPTKARVETGKIEIAQVAQHE